MWFFGGKLKSLTASYPNGRKRFCCSFQLNELKCGEEQTSVKITSGYVSWFLALTKADSNTSADKFELHLKCVPEVEKLKADWCLTADNIIQLVHSEDTDKNRVLVNTSTRFTSTTDSHVSFALRDSQKYFYEENNKITFQVEIGIKTISQLDDSLDFTLKSETDDVVFSVKDIKFYAEKKKMSELSTIFKADLASVSELKIENATPESFHVFLKIIHKEPFNIQNEMLDELLSFGEHYEVPLVTQKCSDFMEKAIYDDSLLIEIADRHGLQPFILKRIATIKTIGDLMKAFKGYRRFSDETMRVLLNKFMDVS